MPEYPEPEYKDAVTRGVREPRTRRAGVALTRCDPCLDGRSNLSLAACAAVLLYPSSCVLPGLLTRHTLNGEANPRAGEPAFCAMLVRFDLPRATQSIAPGRNTALTPSPRVFVSINVMVLCAYSKSFFGQIPPSVHTYSGCARTSARAMPARSSRAGAATKPAAANTRATSCAAPAPTSTTRRPQRPMSRPASRLSAR
jgi:hypothetical protein